MPEHPDHAAGDDLPPRCRIIGVLDDGPASLGTQALAHLAQADLVIGAARTLALFASHLPARAERRDLTGHLREVPAWIRAAQAQGRRVVVLATGDPLCHGIAAYLQSQLCIEACEVLPNVSTVQLACARLGLPWQDLKILSAHGRDSGEWSPGAGSDHGLYPILRALGQADRLAVFTSPDNGPDRIARLLVAEGVSEGWRMAVAERLLQAGERVIADCAVTDAARMRFAEPNIVLLWRSVPRPQPVLFGLADEVYRPRQPDKGLITKREVRALVLARLQMRADSIVWDIGAGSGSVGLEAARLCQEGYVHAIEKNAEDAAIAARNRERLGVHNYTLTHARAPQGMAHWPAPDAVFIGGSGGELGELIRLSLTRLKPGGVLVMSFVTFENLAVALEVLKALNAPWDITQLQAARSRPLLHMHRLAAENPVWIVCATQGPPHD